MVNRRRATAPIGVWVAMLAVAPPSFAALTISTAPTQNVTCSANACTPTASDATLNVDALLSLLVANDVTVNSGQGTGIQAHDIVVAAKVSWNTSTRLTLDAARSVTVSRSILVPANAGLAFSTNDGESGGMLFFAAGSRADFATPTGSLVINGTAYALEDSLASLAAAIDNNPEGAYALTRDIDVANAKFTTAPIEYVNGALQGLGHVISHLTVRIKMGSRAAEAALVQTMNTAGHIENLTLADVDVSATTRGYALAGGMVALDDGMLFNDHVSGSVVASAGAAGGLAGGGNGPVSMSSSSADVTGGQAGGLIGSSGGSVSASHASGTVTIIFDGQETESAGGGLIGFSGGPVAQSYATGHVVAVNGREGGGLIGQLDGSTVTDCYARGNVGEPSFAGGLIGETIGNPDVITTSYSTGHDDKHATFAGGAIGNSGNSNTYRHLLWDRQTSHTHAAVGEGSSAGIKGRTSAFLTSGLPRGFSPAVWGQAAAINDGYPYLLAAPAR